MLLRWGDPVDLSRHLAVLQKVPDQLGEWRYVAEGNPILPSVAKELQLRGYAHRMYENAETGQQAAVLLLIGPAGPLVRHPPEICYETSANSLLNSTSLTIQSAGHRDELRLLSYQSDSLAAGEFLVAYGFGTDQGWASPASPRFAYGGQPVLYKLQVLTEADHEASQSTSAGIRDLLTQLLPALNTEMMSAWASPVTEPVVHD
jgi:hypothetical protein